MTIRSIIGWMIAVTLFVAPVYANEGAGYGSSGYSMKASKVSATASNDGEELLDLDAAALKSRLETLDRRVSELEREHRFQTERIRQLDRSVDDLKRRK